MKKENIIFKDFNLLCKQTWRKSAKNTIFAVRAGDTGKDPVPGFKKSIIMAKKFKNLEILWASVREPYNYL